MAVEAEAEAVTEAEALYGGCCRSRTFGIEAAAVEEDFTGRDTETAEAEPWSLEIVRASTEELIGILKKQRMNQRWL
jgi:hypothetical protein